MNKDKAGLYKCEASSDYGSTQSSAVVKFNNSGNLNMILFIFFKDYLYFFKDYLLFIFTFLKL